MKKLVHNTYGLRENVLVLLGVCLGLYFGWHAVYGARSFSQLESLQHALVQRESALDSISADRESLEAKVKMMRPGSISRDLLEEQARYVLGYKRQDELVVFDN
ncbi:MAG: septum formation initiator family protein [Alphaproteobacteria bacterium]|nr:septum formation initiator family protein [Alphaproteobacteria bacterium]